MHDRAQFWSLIPDWAQVSLHARGIDIAVVDPGSIWLVSGDIDAFAARHGAGETLGPRKPCSIGVYALRVAPDRILFIGGSDDIDAPVGRFQMHLHARIGDHEVRDHAGHARVEQRDRACHAHHPARFRTGELDGFLGRFRLDQHGFAVRVEILADLGHREVPRRALDQAHAEALLEHGDAAAELRLGNAERAAGWREAAPIDDLREVIEVVQVQHEPLIVPPIGL